MIGNGRQTRTTSKTPKVSRSAKIVGNNLLVENIRKPDKITNTIMDNVIGFIETIDEFFNFELFNYFKEESKNIILQLSPSVATSSTSTSLIATSSVPNYENTIFFEYIKNIYKDNENVFTLGDNSNDINYILMKYFLDANDIVHDAKKPNLGDPVSYLVKLEQILIDLKTKSSSSSSLSLDCFNNVNITDITGLSEDRETKLNDFIRDLRGDLKLKVEATFTLNEGFSLFLQEIYDNINLYNKKVNSKSSFTYKESGRDLDIVKHFEKKLETDAEKNTFKKMFENDTLTQLFDDIIKNKNNDDPEYLYIHDIKKDAISAFDACGQTMNGKNDTDVQIFKNIYGIYDYHVKSFRIKNTSGIICDKSIHIVVVTYSKSYINLLTPPIDNNTLVRAIFLIQGEPSINFLVKTSREILKSSSPVPRGGGPKPNPGKRKASDDVPVSGKKQKTERKIDDTTPYLIKNTKWFCNGIETIFPISSSSSSSSSSYTPNFENSKNKIIEHVNNHLNDILSSLSSLSSSYNFLTSIDFPTGYWFNSSDKNEQQLLLYGNKTVGDLIFSCNNYKEQIYALGTVDSYIRASVFYNYLSGNNTICPSVWRQANGGWSYTEGIFKKEPAKSAVLICIKIASILTFIKYYEKYYEKNLSDINENLTNFIKNAFNIDDDNDFMRSISNIEMDRIEKCFENINIIKNNQENIMKAFYKLRTNNSVTINDVLSYVLINYEILNKKKIFDNYLEKLKENIPTPTSTPNDVDIIKHIDSFSNLSNILYVNTISLYKNNKSTDALPTLKKLSTENESNKMKIFNISPELKKVIIKEYIKNDDDTYTKKTTINFICINDTSNKDEKINFVYIVDDDVKKPEDNQYLVKEGNYRYIKDHEENIHPCLKEIDIVDKGLYFKLINDTIEHPILEIIIFSYQVITTNNTNLRLLGKYKRGYSTTGRDSSRPPPLYLHIYLLNLENIIENLLKLLEYKSIKEDTNSTTLIISKIKNYYIDNLNKYAENNKEKCNEYIYKLILNNIKNISNVNDFSNIIIDNFIESKINEIKLYDIIENKDNIININDNNKNELKKYNKIIYDNIYDGNNTILNNINVDNIKELLTNYKNKCCKDISEMCKLIINGIDINISKNYDNQYKLENENFNINSYIDKLNKITGLKSYTDESAYKTIFKLVSRNFIDKMDKIYNKAKKQLIDESGVSIHQTNIITNSDIFKKLIEKILILLNEIFQKNVELIDKYEELDKNLKFDKNNKYNINEINKKNEINCEVVPDDTSMEQVSPISDEVVPDDTTMEQVPQIGDEVLHDDMEQVLTNNIMGGSPPTMNDIIQKIIEKLEYFYNPNKENENLFVGPADEDDYLYYGEDDEVVDDDMLITQVSSDDLKQSSSSSIPINIFRPQPTLNELITSESRKKVSPYKLKQSSSSSIPINLFGRQKTLDELITSESRKKVPQYSQELSQDTQGPFPESESEGEPDYWAGKRTKKRNIVGKKKTKKTKRKNNKRKNTKRLNNKRKNTRRRNTKRRNTKRRNK